MNYIISKDLQTLENSFSPSSNLIFFLISAHSVQPHFFGRLSKIENFSFKIGVFVILSPLFIDKQL